MIQFGVRSSRMNSRKARRLLKGIEMTTTAKVFLSTVGAALALIAARPDSASAQATEFFPLTPCRVVDTRTTNAPILSAQTTRSFAVKGTCGVPNDATAISYNLTAVSPTQSGHMRMFPAGVSLPLAAAVTFNANAVIGNGGVVAIAAGSPDLSLWLNAGQAHAVIDVTGYFKAP
jgi:hypothetical protein